MIQTFQQNLPHGITLSCRASGEPGRPVLLFLHGFPEAAFVWDPLLEHFARPENGGYRCVAPNLRGFEQSSAPVDVAAYRAKHLVADIAALIAIEAGSAPLECLVAHDWGGAVAWNLANQRPELARRLAIVNSPHPGTFLRELKTNPRQQQASAYMNFLIRPDAEQLLAEDDFRRLFGFLTNGAPTPWLTEEVRQQYREVWSRGLTGGCNYYRASPIRPPTPQDPGAAAIELPHSMLTVSLPTLVLWAMDDVALPPELVDGLDGYIPKLTLEKVEGASHWIVHERPQLVAQRLAAFLLSNP
ncbi:alpha/beta hydrolase [uncultured Ramlibacter sp.]|uniref:alpha/beta fold hydrolase n=1 Tax=uncultured Ramlibacter sp. TaxID=260755 RepID=UPI002616E471|nr:alpha/beta hydrolase [uncultured Ramlibacter sp.]